MNKKDESHMRFLIRRIELGDVLTPDDDVFFTRMCVQIKMRGVEI